MNPIEERVARIERSAAWWRIAALCLGGVVAIRTFSGADAPSGIQQANTFAVMNNAGKKVIELTSDAAGAGQLILFDQNGNPRTTLGFRQDNSVAHPILKLVNDNGDIGASIAVSSEGYGSIQLAGTDVGGTQHGLTSLLSSAQGGQLMLYDRSNNPTVTVTALGASGWVQTRDGAGADTGHVGNK
jgi:hypothetical protein